MKAKRKAYIPVAAMLAATLISMRETAYGKEAQLQIHKTLDRSERMRNDAELLSQAKAKRFRKRQIQLELKFKFKGDKK